MIEFNQGQKAVVFKDNSFIGKIEYSYDEKDYCYCSEAPVGFNYDFTEKELMTLVNKIKEIREINKKLDRSK